MKRLRKYLFWFANDHVDFRLAEIESIVSMFKTSIKWLEKPSEKPYWIVELPSEDVANQIASRSMSLKSISEIWGRATQLDELHSELKLFFSETLPLECKSACNMTYKIDVTVYCNSQSLEDRMSKINSFNYLPFKGGVKLKNPDITMKYIEYYGVNPNKIPDKPYEIFFGKLITPSQRKIISHLSLKKRKFIGTTSMDAELSLLMANQARVTAGDLVYDPFVGTGSLLVAAAYFGAYVMGVDIDFLMLHGRTKPTRAQARHLSRKNESVLANMKQYGLENQYIDVVIADSSVPLWNNNLVLDAIITDPPYGMREATERIGRKCSKYEADRHFNGVHYPSKIVYEFHQIMNDLLCFAGIHLKIGGTLVTWVPIMRADYNEFEYVPHHPCFKIVSNSEQILSHSISRRLLTYEKIRQPQVEEVDICRSVDTNFRDKYLNYRFKREMGKDLNRDKDTEVASVL